MSNYIKTTPLIQRLNITGGTLFTFPSAGEDLNLTLQGLKSDIKFRFSNFALLNIPDILNNQKQNTIKLKAIPGAFNSVNFTRTTDYNVHFTESLQNYCLNLETGLINDSGYDYTQNRTVSERVFFKWLKELGAIRFKNSNVTTADDVLFEEEDESENYKRVIKYIGEFDFVNSGQSSKRTSTQIYCHVPTDVGSSSKVLFKTISDTNYYPGKTISNDNNTLDDEVIYGRKYTDIHPDNLDINAFYDNDGGLFNVDDSSDKALTLYKKKPNVPDTNDDIENPDHYTRDSWWFPISNDNNSYYLEPTNIGFKNASNTDLAIYSSNGFGFENINENALKLKRSNLDGITIDFSPSDYSVESLYDLNTSEASSDFEFNTVLIYYELYTENFDSEGNQLDDTILSNNLFGSLFLDNFEPTSLGGAYIPRLKKIKPNQIFNLNGNAYGFKIDLELDISPLNVGVKVKSIISDSNTLSMDMFADALSEMKNANETVNKTFSELLEITNILNESDKRLQLMNVYDIDSINQKIKSIENSYKDLDKIKIDSIDKIYSVYSEVNNKLDQILLGRTNIKVGFDYGTISNGPGIGLTRSERGLQITNEQQDYTYSDNFIFKYTDFKETPGINPSERYLDIEYYLYPYKNYIRLENDDIGYEFQPNSDIRIFIKDDLYSWKKGQTLRIVFASPYIMKNQFGQKNLLIYTDYKNITKKTKNYGVLVRRITTDEFLSKNGKPILEINCYDEENLKFFTDII